MIILYSDFAFFLLYDFYLECGNLETVDNVASCGCVELGPALERKLASGGERFARKQASWF